MTIEYNKKKGRVVYGGGPRDLQRKQQQTAVQPVSSPEFYETIIKDLKDQLKVVTEEVMKRGNVDPSKKFTAEEFDEELTKQVGSMIKDLDKAKKEVKELSNKVISLEAKLEAKDEVISALKSRTVGEGEVFVEDKDRPEMKTAFIDPTEAGQNRMESHIKVEEESITAKADIDDKVNKLKNLIGSVKR